MLNGFNLLLLALVVVIVAFIVIAVRKTMGEMTKAGVTGEDARELAKRLRERDVRCPRCNGQSSALLGTDTRYKCDSCHFEFEGPSHLGA